MLDLIHMSMPVHECFNANAIKQITRTAYICQGHEVVHWLTGALGHSAVTCVLAVGVFPFRTNMTRKMKMGYVQLQMQPACNLFPAGVLARGHVYHFSEIVQERVLGGLGASGEGGAPATAPGTAGTSADWHIGYSATMQVPGV